MPPRRPAGRWGGAWRESAASQHPLRTSSPRRTGSAIAHQWSVTAERQSAPATPQQDFGINPLTGQAFFSASVFNRTRLLASDRLWRITVGEGCVNGIPARVATLPLWQNPAPGLIVTTPSADGRDPGDFQRVPDPQRPRHFRTADAWESDLWRTSVYLSGIRPLSADPLLDVAVLDLALLPDAPTLVGLLAGVATREILASLALDARIPILPLLPPYKVHAGTIPLILDGTEQFRLAWLYLLRKPGDPPSADALEIEQLCFWNLAAYSLLEDQGQLAIGQLLSTTGDIGALTALEIVQQLLDSVKIRWWSR